jgi:hypothetical protein
MKQKFLDKNESEKIFKEGFILGDYWEMVGYARYAHHYEGWTRDKILKNMKLALAENGQNIILLRKTIFDALKGYKFDFQERSEVEVSIPEIEKIKLVNIRDYQRALFGILVLSKQKGGFYGDKLFYGGNLKELIRTSGTYFTDKDFKEFLYFSKKYGFINSFIKREKKKKNSVKIVWVITFYKEGDIYCSIDKFDKVQTYLPTWCAVCKTEIKRGKYCSEHRNRRKTKNGGFNG